MANAAPVMIWMAGPDAGCTFFNQRWLDFTGRSMDEEIGNGWAQGVHPEDRPRCLSVYLESFALRQEFQLEYRLRRSDGQYRWVYDIGTALFAEDGAFSGYIGSCVDITERKQAEEALRASEDRYRDLVENSGILFGTHDLEGRVLSVNQAVVQLSGCAGPAELVGRKVSDFLAQGVQHLFEAYLETVRQEGHARGLMKVFTRGGETRIVEYSNSVRREGVERPVVRCIGRDVTEERRAKQISRSQTAALVRTLGLLGAERSLETFLGHVLKAITEQLSVSSSALYLLEGGNGARLHMSYQRGQMFPGGEIGHPFALRPVPFAAEDRAWRELSTGHPMVIDVSAGELPPEAEEWLRAEGVSTVVLIPLMIREHLAGVLSLRISDRHLPTRAETELAQALAQQASLALELTRLAEEGQRTVLLQERNRMAQEIHDTLAQGFAGIVVQLEAAEDALAENPEEARSHIIRARSLARENLAEARRSVWALRPQKLEHGLPAAIRSLAEQLTQATMIRAEFALKGTPHPLPAEAENNLMRISQEALANVLKHANANRIRIEMAFGKRQVKVCVEDDGRGFNPRLASAAQGFGLISMRERAQRVGGSLRIHSKVGEGTRIEVVVPAFRNGAR
jgi:PAS domain S-box-containing protein